MVRLRLWSIHVARRLGLRRCKPGAIEWAGHSVQVLLRVYAKCIEGQENAARRRISDALGVDDDEHPEP